MDAQIALVGQRVQAGTGCTIGNIEPDVGVVFAANLGSLGFSLFGVEVKDALYGVEYGEIHLDGLLSPRPGEGQDVRGEKCCRHIAGSYPSRSPAYVLYCTRPPTAAKLSKPPARAT